MPARSVDSGDVWTEPANPTDVVRRGVIVQVAPNHYHIQTEGAEAASLVATPMGYAITVGDLTGTGTIAFVGDRRALIY
jgi:hypothetical protein